MEAELQNLINFLAQIIKLIPQGLAAPLLYIVEPARRIYWLFLLSSVALIFLTYYIQYKKISFTYIYKSIFSFSYWFNRSSATDVFYLSLNSILRISLLIPLFGSHLWASILVTRFLQANFDNGPDLAMPLLLIMGFYTLVFFIVEDFSRFALHLCMHKIPFLWRFHKIHHSATVLTPLTVHRVHPLEMCLYFIRGTCIFGLVSGSFVYLFGSRLGGLEILGVDALGFLFNLLGANLRHSHIWLGFGRLERWFISPAQHQLHHSSAPVHRDKNFGTCLAIWDKLFHSWLSSGKRQKLVFGLNRQDTVYGS